MSVSSTWGHPGNLKLMTCSISFKTKPTSSRSFAYAQCPDQRFHVPSLAFIGAFSRDLLSLALCSPMQGGAARAARTLRFRGRVFDRRASAWGSPGHALCMHSDQPASIILGASPRSAATWRLQEATSPVPGLAITRLRTGVGGRLRREVWGRSGSNIWGQSPPFREPSRSVFSGGAGRCVPLRTKRSWFGAVAEVPKKRP